MSVAQQRGEPEEQRPAWRSSRGAARAAAARARTVKYCMLMICSRWKIETSDWLIIAIGLEVK